MFYFYRANAGVYHNRAGETMALLLDFFIKPSTRAFIREARSRPECGFFELLHGLFYLKWPELYIKVGLGRGRAARLLREPACRLGKLFGLWDEGAKGRFADTYHGKVMPLEGARRLILVNRALRMDVPEKVLPYALARDIILDNPNDLALMRCPCRASALNPCAPLDVCIIVGQPFVDFVCEHHPEKTRRITPQEAVSVVEQAQKRGHVTHAFFKEAVLGRYYAICNCCACCCGAMQAHRSGTPMLASSGYVARLDLGACVGCGVCVSKCQFGALLQNKAKEAPLLDDAACMGCGVCVPHCAKKALRLERDKTRPAPLVL